jgi:tetraprenyl-beta-curcumene synthase
VTPGDIDPAPLSSRQIWALCAAATRELLWGLRAVAGEVEHWRARALSAPDAPVREDALGALARKRPHLDGAALFWILPRRRNRRLLRLLVSYEVALEFLDNTNERAAHAGPANGRQLHRALAEALAPDAPISDHYRHHPWKRDGGYLQALVECCRRDCASLPSYALVSELAIREAARCQVLALNHDPDPVRREDALREWARRECPNEVEMRWFELSGAATASLTVHVLLALGAEAASTASVVDGARAVYFPGLSLATTMLDSYVDRSEDAASGGHSYIAHYGGQEIAVARLQALIGRSTHGARCLPNGHRHAVLASSMVAMYLSSDSAREAQSRPATRQLLRAGGSLARLLAPVLRIWRILYALRSA